MDLGGTQTTKGPSSPIKELWDRYEEFCLGVPSEGGPHDLNSHIQLLVVHT